MSISAIWRLKSISSAICCIRIFRCIPAAAVRRSAAFCLWPQTIGGHKYRVRSPQNVADEMAYMKKIFPQVREFFFDDDTFTANLPRAREIAKKLGPLGVHWSCNSRANLDYDTIKSFKDNGLRLFLVGYESGNDDILTRIKKGVTMDEMRRFTKSCHAGRRGNSRHVHSRIAGGNEGDD